MYSFNSINWLWPKDSVQTKLGAQPGLETQFRHKAPSDLWIETAIKYAMISIKSVRLSSTQ